MAKHKIMAEIIYGFVVAIIAHRDVIDTKMTNEVCRSHKDESVPLQ